MATLERGGVRLHYEILGDGSRTPLLLTHGFSASGAMWAANVGALDTDRRVVTWDMRGHARSDAPGDPGAYGVEQSVADMAALLDAAGADRAVLAGMSLGGYLSLAFYAQRPERVAGLILIDTGPGFRREQPRQEWNAFAERVAQSLETTGSTGLASSAETVQHPSVQGLAHTARQVMAQHDALVIESLACIAVPTLCVVGAFDTDYLAAAEYMTAKIPGARKVVLENAGHAANIDAAEAFNSAVNDFLEDI